MAVGSDNQAKVSVLVSANLHKAKDKTIIFGLIKNKHCGCCNSRNACFVVLARDILPFRMEADFLEKGLAVANTVAAEVINMLTAVWLMLSSLLYSLQLSTGSFPRPLTDQEEQYYLQRVAQGDLEARNILIERNLRLVAHIMNKS